MHFLFLYSQVFSQNEGSPKSEGLIPCSSHYCLQEQIRIAPFDMFWKLCVFLSIAWQMGSMYDCGPLTYSRSSIHVPQNEWITRSLSNGLYLLEIKSNGLYLWSMHPNSYNLNAIRSMIHVLVEDLAVPLSLVTRKHNPSRD